MKSKAKLFMLMLSLALLTGAWILAEYMSGAFDAEEAAAADSGAALIDLSVGAQEEITALSWSYDGQTVNLARDGQTGVWTNADDGTCPIDGEKAEALAAAAASVAADMEITAASELADYGLAEPAVTVIAATREAVAGYEIGNRSITGQYYLRLSGGDAVYLETGTLAPAFQIGIEDVLALESVPEDIATVTGLSVRTDVESYELSRSGGGVWLLTEGGQREEIQESAARHLYEPVTELELSLCATWNLQEPDDYGLTEPQGRATVSYIADGGGEERFTLEFGGYADSGVYVRFSGSDIVYIVPGTVLDGLMYPDWEALLPLEVLPIDKQSVANIAAILDGYEYDIDRLRETGEETADGEAAAETVIYSCNGWGLDADAMDGWLDALAGLTAERLAPGAEGRELLLSVTLVWNDDTGSPAALEIWSYDSARCLCVIDGERKLLADKTKAEELIAALASILTAE